MSASLPSDVQRFVDTLVAQSPAPAEVWLIGSRANGRATANSDTDLLAFGSAGFLQALKASATPLAGVDCIVVDERGEGQDPWQEKRLSLASLNWNRIDQQSARYVGTKWIADEDEPTDSCLGELRRIEERALRLWSAGRAA